MPGIPSEDSIRRWFNFNSFAARLFHKELAFWNSNWPFTELVFGLEHSDRAQMLAECDLIVAAEWIIQSGDVFFAVSTGHNCHKDCEPFDQPRPERGILYTGKGEGFCKERWDFWKMRFGELSEQVGQEAGQRAKLAMERMNEIEEAEGKSGN